MRARYLILVIYILTISCRLISMEPVDLKLKLHNRSDTPLAVLLNPSYPDTTLSKSWVDKHLDPKESLYIGTMFVDWDDVVGITVFAFDDEYYDLQHSSNNGSPDTYLDEKKVLKKWILTRTMLDSINWQIYYP